MSIAAARSPSPGPPARPCCGLRRSADSSPFRPAASPPDSPQRSSSVCKNSGRVSPRTWGAEKENEPRDAAGTGDASARTHKVRSSGGCGGGGGVCVTKSFMAPTISAASKAVAPSATPRKKVLGERNNDPVPSSPVDLAHSSKPRGPHPPPPDEALGAPRRLRLSLDGASAPPPPAAGPVISRGVRSFGGDEAAVMVENPVPRNDHHDAASADAEAVAAPYDPKTNYLSPRPRYLRYQPNRHLEIYRHGGGSVRGLEDRFASESSSEEVDTATTTEEEVSVEDQSDDSSEEETSALASPSEARAQPVAPALDGLLLPQPALDSPLPRVLTPEGKESQRVGGVLIPDQEPAVSPAQARPRKKRSSMRLLLAPLALILLMAAAFVCVPPPPGHPVMLNTSLSKVSDFLSVQELHPVELAARLKQWSSSSLDFVTSYWAEAIASYQERDVFGPHLAANLSAAAADVDADYAVAFYYSTAQTSPISLELGIQEVVSESDTEMIAEPDVEELATYGDPNDIEMEQEDVSGLPSAMEEVNADAVVEEFSAEMAEEVSNADAVAEELSAEMAEEVSNAEIAEEVSTAEMVEEVSGSSGEETAAFIQNSDTPSQSTPEPEQAEGIDEVSLQQDVQTEDSKGDHADGKEDQEAQHGEKLGSDMWPSYLDKISDPAAIGAALAAIIVAAAVAFLYMRKKQTRVASNEPTEQVEQAEQVEQIEQVEQAESLSGSGSSQGHVVAKGSLFSSPGLEETERLGGSGPSQYSSSLSSGLGRRRNTKGEEYQVSRRDSTAQSTSSYGSFTTYQKIPAKKGNKEDEVMTPVRRSSRLRNVKSPEA